jgi:predicted nucleic acid-binding Zn ribbon protein
VAICLAVEAKAIPMYSVACPYCADAHVVVSPYWDDIEKAIEECMRKAAPERLGRLGWVIEHQFTWCRGDYLEPAT